MKIEFTNEEYKTLVELIYLGNWMIESTQEDIDSNTQYNQLEQKVLSFADQYGAKDIIEEEQDGGQYVHAESFEEESGLFEVIENYNDDIFWSELASRMMERDMEKKHGANLDKMNEEERMKEEIELLEDYDRYFEEHGIENITK